MTSCRWQLDADRGSRSRNIAIHRAAPAALANREDRSMTNTDPSQRIAKALKRLGDTLTSLWSTGDLSPIDAKTTVTLQDAVEAAHIGNRTRAQTWFVPDGSVDGGYLINLEGAVLLGMSGDDEWTSPRIFTAELIALWKQGRLAPVGDTAATRLQTANTAAHRIAPNQMRVLDALAKQTRDWHARGSQ